MTLSGFPYRPEDAADRLAGLAIRALSSDGSHARLSVVAPSRAGWRPANSGRVASAARPFSNSSTTRSAAVPARIHVSRSLSLSAISIVTPFLTSVFRNTGKKGFADEQENV